MHSAFTTSTLHSEMYINASLIYLSTLAMSRMVLLNWENVQLNHLPGRNDVKWDSIIRSRASTLPSDFVIDI
jgi:hypothetical protein